MCNPSRPHQLPQKLVCHLCTLTGRSVRSAATCLQEGPARNRSAWHSLVPHKSPSRLIRLQLPSSLLLKARLATELVSTDNSATYCPRLTWLLNVNTFFFPRIIHFFLEEQRKVILKWENPPLSGFFRHEMKVTVSFSATERLTWLPILIDIFN